MDMNFQTILMPKVILAKYLSQKSWSLRTILVHLNLESKLTTFSYLRTYISVLGLICIILLKLSLYKDFEFLVIAKKDRIACPFTRF